MLAKLGMFIVLALPLVLLGLPDAQGAEPGHTPVSVLILNSYHPGFTWTDNEMKGIGRGLQADYPEADPYIEYMDAKRFGHATVRSRFIELLKAKVHGSDYPVIITTDNIALQLALDVRPELFPRAQIVFCGVNGPPEDVIRGRMQVTGVTETWDPAGTLKVIDRLQPGVQEIVVLHDYTESGLGTRKNLDAVLPAFQNRFRFRFLPPQPVEGILQALAKLSDTSAVLLMGYNRDSRGKVFDSAATGPLFARHARVPVYTMDQTRFSGGVVGGSLLSGERQGELAAAMAARILRGASADAIPIIRAPVAVLTFDYTALRRFGLSPAALPPGSRIINLPTSFYHLYRYQIWAVTAFIIILFMLIVGLACILLSRRRMDAERAKAVKALRESEENLRITLDSIGDAVIATDAHGVILRMNPTAATLTGWAVDEVLGKPLSEVFRIVAAVNQEAIESPVERVLREGQTVYPPECPCLLRRRDCAERMIAASAAPIRDANNVIVGVVLVFRDITAEHAMQERLRHSQRLEVLGQLAGGVAHDFNNILTAILGAGQLLALRFNEGSKEHKLADEIVGGALRATDLIRQLLNFSRKGPLQNLETSVHSVIRDVIRLLNRSIDRMITIRQDLHADPDTIMGDAVLLHSAILNLAVNARDAMPKGGELTISTGIVTLDADYCRTADLDLEPGEFLQIAVRDTGTGMREEVRARLFEPYFTTKPVGQGTGLGLAAVYGCVQSHRGHIQVESAPGEGSTFILFLPLLRTESRPESVPAPTELVKGKGHILLIDDEEPIRTTTAQMLGALGYQVVTAGDGYAGIDYFKVHQAEIDLVILDLIMPRISGREVFTVLRRIAPAARILLCSGYSQRDVTDKLIREGAAGFINKPFRMEDLSLRISMLMKSGVNEKHT